MRGLPSHTPALALLLVVSCLVSTAAAEHLRASGGGTKTEPDPKQKKQVRIVAESDAVCITVGSSPRGGKFKQSPPVAAIYVRVENRTDEALTVDPSKFSAVDDTGRGYVGLEPDEATRRILDAVAGRMYVASSVLAGPMGGAHLQSAAERKIGAEMNKQALQPGDVPPHSFKEGLVFIEAPQIKQGAVKIHLTGLWSEPFLFTVEK